MARATVSISAPAYAVWTNRYDLRGELDLQGVEAAWLALEADEWFPSKCHIARDSLSVCTILY